MSVEFALECFNDIISMADIYKDLVDNSIVIKRQKVESSSLDDDSEISIKYAPPAEETCDENLVSSTLNDTVRNSSPSHFWNCIMAMEVESHAMLQQMDSDSSSIESVSVSQSQSEYYNSASLTRDPHNTLPVQLFGNVMSQSKMQNASKKSLEQHPSCFLHAEELTGEACEYEKEEKGHNSDFFQETETETEMEAIQYFKQPASPPSDEMTKEEKEDLINYKMSESFHRKQLQVRTFHGRDDKRYLLGIVEKNSPKHNPSPLL